MHIQLIFCRSNSFHRRASNRHLLNFVDIFKDHYFSSGPFERQQIVRRIVEMLQNDGYSFWKQQRRAYLSSRTVPAVIESSDEVEGEGVEERSLEHKRSLWSEMTPMEVQKSIAQFFKKPAPSLDWRQQHDHHHKQQVAAVHQAISTAIDARSLVTNQQNRDQYEIAALDKAITSAIDASSLAEAIRDCPSPESTLPLSTSSSLSAFDPVISLSESRNDDQLILESSLLSVSPGSSPTMEHEMQEAPIVDEKEFTDMLTSISPVTNDGKQDSSSFAAQANPMGKTEVNDTLPQDGILWSSGTQQIQLLESMESSIVPIKSVSLFSNVQKVAFEKQMAASVTLSRQENSNGDQSRTIGYTRQIVGNLTILRPIVLLPE